MREHFENEDDSRLVVYAPWPEGGHPEYVRKLMEGLVSERGVRVVWPVRDDLETNARSRRLEQPPVLPAFPRLNAGRFGRVMDRLLWSRRPEFAFARFLRRSEMGAPVLVEEIPKWTFPLFTWMLRRQSRKVFVQLHNVRRHDYTGGIVSRLEEWWTSRGLRAVDLIIVHTEGNRSALAKMRGIRGNVEVVPHGIEPRVNTPLPPPATPAFMFFGVNRPNKGLAHLLSAMDHLEAPVRLVVAGVTPADQVERAADLLEGKANVTWMNQFISDAEVERLVVDTTAFVLPYLDFEAQSGVLHLAIEWGIPVVVSTSGGMSETVRTFDIGVVYETADVEGLAAALTQLADVDRNSSFRRNAIEAHESLCWSVVGGRLGSLIGL